MGSHENRPLRITGAGDFSCPSGVLMEIKKLLICLSVILVLLSSCTKKEEAVTEEMAIEEAGKLGSMTENRNPSSTVSPSDMESLVESALSIYEETRIDERPLVPVVADDGDLCYLQFVYSESDGGYILESGPYYRGTLYIPATVDDIPVVGIADYAFYGSKTLTGIGPMPETIRTIGKYAFADSTRITGELVLPSSLEIIGEYAFSGTDLEGTLAFPSSVRKISEGAFSGTYFSFLMMDEGVETIGAKAFASMIYLTGDIYIPSSMKSIADDAFDGCYALDGSYLVTPAGFFQVSI